MEKTLFIGMLLVMTSALCLVAYDIWKRIKREREEAKSPNAFFKKEVQKQTQQEVQNEVQPEPVMEPFLHEQPLPEPEPPENHFVMPDEPLESTPEPVHFATEPEENNFAPRNPADELMKDLLILSVMAKPGDNFASYDLLQAITAGGLQFGDMNLFHYYSYLDPKNLPLFSLASATEPGQFDMDKIGDFSCAGLTLFTNLKEQSDPVFAFEVMLKTAEQLADDLQGNLYAGQRTPWSNESFQSYKKKALSYQAHKFA